MNSEVADKIVAIDSKTPRGSRYGEQLPIHLVSAFANEAGIVLGQLKTHEKSNEIKAIPELLKWLDVRGAIVTIDEMGYQKAIAEKIIDKGDDYLLALKGNQVESPERTALSGAHRSGLERPRSSGSYRPAVAIQHFPMSKQIRLFPRNAIQPLCRSSFMMP